MADRARPFEPALNPTGTAGVAALPTPISRLWRPAPILQNRSSSTPCDSCPGRRASRNPRVQPGTASRDLRRVADPPPERRGPRVLLHPGSRSSYRIWPLDRFARVADRLQTELGAQVILAGGPSEQALIDGIRAAARTPLAVLPPSVDLGALRGPVSGRWMCSFAMTAARCTSPPR